MSHFPLLILTHTKPTVEDIESIIAPWSLHEQLEDENGLYRRYDWTQKIAEKVNEVGLAAALKEFRLDGSIVADEADFDPEAFPYFAVVRDGVLIKAVGPACPDPKLDYWQLGGRFTGLLAPGYDPTQDPDNIEVCRGCGGTGTRTDFLYEDGCNLCRGSGRSLKYETAWAPIGIQVAWGTLDLAALRDAQASQATLTYDAFYEVVGAGAVWESRKAVNARISDGQEADASYWAQPIVKRLKTSKTSMRFQPDQDHFLLSREAFIQDARHWALAPVAVVKDGRWHERPGNGFLQDRDVDGAWPDTVDGLLADLPPTAWLSVVDCHY